MPRFALFVSALAALGTGCRTSGPASGEWVYSHEVLEEDSCGIDYSPLSGTFFVENHNDGTFTVDPDDGTDPFLCTVVGDAYHCPERYVTEIAYGPIVGQVHATAYGTLHSAISGEGEQRATVDCANETCEAAIALLGVEAPCIIRVSHHITRVR